MKKAFITGGSGFVGQNLIPMLVADGYEVVALARSENAVTTVENLGAKAIKGDLNNKNAIVEGLQYCDTVFHLAAIVDFSKTEKELRVLHVDATMLMLTEAKKAGVSSFVYLGAASVIMNGKPICGADESFVSNNIMDGYSKTKLEAEQFVIQANQPGFKTISLRPSLIWGKGEPHILPILIDAINKGMLQFIGGGRHKFITCHVKNVCHALLLADKAQQGGNAYFITDGEPLTFKDFVQRYVGTQGVTAPDKEVSLRMAWIVAYVMEFVWKIGRLQGQPPLTKAVVYATGIELTVSDNKARRELGYKTIISFEEGFEEMKN